MKTARFLLISLRPAQWMKNLFIFIPLIFSQRIFQPQSLYLSVQAFLLFSLLASAVYLLNDVADMESDRNHPEKKYRPLAAGLLPPAVAKTTAAVLVLVSLFWAAQINIRFFLIIMAYLAVQMLYNFRLKEVVILDIFCISSGFFMRILAGGAAIQVKISHWLIICSILLSLFLALAKRRHELMILGDEGAGRHRKVLLEYQLPLLDQMIAVITASTLLSYMLYCVSADTIKKFQTDQLIYTFPFVLYGIFRYLYLIHVRKQGGAPEKIIASDWLLLLSVILWGSSSILIIYNVI
ncbi:MAG: decaprenyl-phosphate phosphoribosyltransferase [Deltaproteobacteria bacterium]|nr:decaprenyl-phosphate phosphoribosyltransferase [Deltaproteobacteria bacterium]MBW1962198.1 decaprenyl-phosphate phosphoribosyltransferase [Deltaproteobacteria bacterium]MBW1992967.1 decaprenyl-phosphate phosphoribosyltransferase [Deltaproteobacteria bacterium]MBW2152853.1 decaprenyl-phosphate phosphoribosyltransferase [Deltaproteobacteria bacterium]